MPRPQTYPAPIWKLVAASEVLHDNVTVVFDPARRVSETRKAAAEAAIEHDDGDDHDRCEHNFRAGQVQHVIDDPQDQDGVAPIRY